MKFHLARDNETTTQYMFRCPGCKHAHVVITRAPKQPIWTVTGIKEDSPTVSPSVLVWGGGPKNDSRCHSFIKAGKIQFLNDCTHELAGQTVEIPDFNE